ncbi:PstS family phosphate ABC transporter substrate-binding protein [Deminuibacter soli]|nr:substrate-binding domain-containing protein [Deminuibacter soli]
MTACNNKPVKAVSDTPKSGSIHISVDETFKPVVEQLIHVYQNTYPDTKIIASYKSEADCFRDLQSDSTRMIIVAKGLTKAESDYYESKLSFKPTWDILAYDAVSAVINAGATDSLFTMKQLKDLLLAGEGAPHPVVVDGNNATSTVRYLSDSVLKGGTFGKNVMAAAGSKAVLDYVAANKNAIGFVGLSWVGDQEDPGQQAYMQKVRYALLQCTTCVSDTFAKPSQATISWNMYPLVRPLYYVLKENFTGLGNGFVNFMSLERGQLVFRRAYLVPGKMNFNVRKVDNR